MDEFDESFDASESADADIPEPAGSSPEDISEVIPEDTQASDEFYDTESISDDLDDIPEDVGNDPSDGIYMSDSGVSPNDLNTLDSEADIEDIPEDIETSVLEDIPEDDKLPDMDEIPEDITPSDNDDKPEGPDDLYAGDELNDNSQKLESLERECIENELADIVDYHDFDPDVAQVVNDALADAKSDFPNLEVGYIGSIESQVDGIHSTVSEQYERALRESYGDTYSDEQYRASAQQFADDFIKSAGLDDTDGTFAWSLSLPDECGDALTKYNGVGINGKFAGDNDLFTESKVNEVQTKHKPIGCDTPRATADHELGHEIDKLLNASEDDEINRLYSDFMGCDSPQDQLSGYAETNVKEFIAEAYSEYRNNSAPRSYAVSVYNRLIQLRDGGKK